MKKNKLLLNFFSSGLQAIAIQVLGVAFFYILSLYLPKDDFGVINWLNAIAAFITIALGLGLEQSVTRRVALSNTSDWAAASYFAHAIVGSCITLIVYAIISVTVPHGGIALRLFPWIFISQSFIYIVSPLKQYLNARGKFTPYGIISFTSNASKIVLVLLLISSNAFSLQHAVYIMIGTGLFELVSLLLYIKLQLGFSFLFKLRAYKKLVKESLPLYAAAIYDSSLSRVDWILLGILSTKASTADYSFTYRAYEITRLPLLIIAPVILPKFVRVLSGNNFNTERKKDLQQYFTIGIFLCLLALVSMNIVWKEGINAITHGKYGDTAVIFLLISLCLPLHFFINLLWTMSYAAGRYKIISTITLVTAITNLLLNVILIPRYGGLGAAIAYLIATLIQVVLYYRAVHRELMHFSFLSPLLMLAMACCAYICAYSVTNIIILRLLIAIAIYLLLVLATRQINRKHLDVIRLYIKR